MKKNVLLTLVTAFGLLALAGCDTPVNDEGNWLAGVANPLIGTWSYGSGTGARRAEFKNDGTVVVTNTNTDAVSVSPCLVKDNFLVISSSDSPYYTKYFFEVIDNNSLKVVQDGRSSTVYARVGAENPDANRTIALIKGFDGFWRRDNLNFGTEEAANFMYDWHAFRKDGTFHVYHYMNKDKHYIDRGDFSYFIDSGNRLVSLSNGYTVTVYYDFAKSDNAFSWKTSGNGDPLGFERFDGETFWHPAESGGDDGHNGHGM
jgi:hypothetical protein